MPTGSKNLLMNSKQLLGFQDLGLRGFTALRNSHLEATKARWDVDGVFNNKLTMAGSAASTIQVLGSSKSTDGLGHVLDIQAAYRQTATFQNTNAITYHVGLMYAEVPAGLRINPLTGKPQFDSYVEEVGFQAVPNSVVDNGNGTMTMVIDSATEAGVSSAGRLVRVWKLTPADGATTFTIALEEVTSVFTGGFNKITTAAKFGQTAISTTASDYLVTVMGPRVSRGTDLSAVPGVVYIGTCIGNAGTPAVFDNTNQILLKTFQDATQVTYAPTGWLSPGATNVQLALDAIVSGLGNNVSTIASGASKVAVYAPAYDTVAAGGLGNVADSTYSAAATVADILIGINTLAKRRQTFQTKNDSAGGSQSADSASTVDLATQTSSARPQWLRTLANAATTPYTISTDVAAGAGQGSYFMGEYSDPTNATLHLRKTAIKATGSGSSRAVSLGKWQRVWLDSNASMSWKFGGAGAVNSSILEDFGANGGTLFFDINASPSAVDGATNWRNGIIKPKASEVKIGAASITYGNATTDGWVWSVMEKLLIYGNDSTQSGGSRFGAIDFGTRVVAPIEAATVALQGRPVVYRDCVFVCQDTTSQGLVVISGTQSITFENCKFFDISGRTSASALFKIQAVGAQVHLKNCVFFSPEGNCLSNGGSAMGLVVEDCSFVSGIGGTGALTAPQVILAGGGESPLTPTFRDCRVYLGTGVFRSNATATSTPLISFSGTLFSVNNFCVKVDSAATDLGFARILDINCNSQIGQGSMGVFDNITIDCNSVKASSTSSNPVVGLTALNTADSSRLCVGRLMVRNTQINVPGGFQQPWVQCGHGVVGDSWMIVASTAAPTNKMGSLIKLNGNNNILRDVRFGRARYAMSTNNGTISVAGNNNKICGVTGDESFNVNNGGGPTASASVIVSTGNHNHFRELDFTLGADSSSVLFCDGRDCALESSNIVTSSNNVVPVQFPSGRRNRYLNNNMHWNGTAHGAVLMSSLDSIVDDCTFLRTAGATAAVSNVASGSITGTAVVTSTTL